MNECVSQGSAGSGLGNWCHPQWADLPSSENPLQTFLQAHLPVVLKVIKTISTGLAPAITGPPWDLLPLP